MAAIYATLFWCALQVTLFLTLAAPIYLFVRRRSPHAATFVAASSLAAVILLSALAASPWPRWSLAMVEGERVAIANGGSTITDVGGDQAKASVTNVGAALGADETTNPTSPLAALWEAVQFAATPTTSAMTAGAPADEPGSRWTVFVVALFLAGMAISGVHLVAGLVAVRRLIAGSRPLEDAPLTAELASLRQRLKITRPVSLHESTEVATPATVGWRRPAVLLPSAWRSWSDVELRAVLAHELAHIAQHDFAAWLIARGAIVVHFYHPLVRWFASRLQLDQELAADAAAVRLLGDRQQYLHALANLALATPMHRMPSHVRTFIPSRSLLVRRVEMLRIAEFAPRRSSSVIRVARAACLASLILIGAMVAGIRPAAAPLQAADEVPAQATSNVAEEDVKSDGYDFSYVPNDALFAIAIRPDLMAASPQLKALADLLEVSIRPPVPVASLAQLTFAMPSPVSDDSGRPVSGASYEYTLFRANQSIDFKALLTSSYGPIKDEEYHGRQLMTQNAGGSITFYSPNDRTLVGHSRPGLERVIDNPQAAVGPENADKWRNELTGPLFAVGNPEAIRKMIAPQSIVNQLFRPVIDAAEQMTLATEDGETFVIRARIVCRKAEDVPRVEQTLQSMTLLARNAVESLAAVDGIGASPSDPAAGSRAPLLSLAKETLGSLEFRTDGATLTIIAKIPHAKSVVADVLLPQLKIAQLAVRRAKSQNNIRVLGLAALTYESNGSAFPPAVVYGRSAFPNLNSSGDKSAHVPRSWRVELLPLLGQEELYKQYRLDQPWDSEANLKVLRQMPANYRSPFDQPTSTNASYFAVVGPGTVFDGEEGTPLAAISDGTSNTLLWVEAKRDIPWTKPEDIAYAAGEAVPAFGGWMKDREFTVAYCDGSVRVLADVAEPALRQLIERADGAAGLSQGAPDNAILAPPGPFTR